MSTKSHPPKLHFRPPILLCIIIIITTFVLLQPCLGGIHHPNVSQPGPQPSADDERTVLNKTTFISNYDQEYKAFEAEMASTSTYPDDQIKSRKRRYLYLNVQSNLDVGFLAVVPITIVLPSMSNLFNRWRRKRSLQLLPSPSTSPNEEEYFTEDHPLLQPHLDKLSTYFQLIDIPEHHCQLRAICEFSADPSSYFPISEMIIHRLRSSSIPSSIIYNTANDSRPSLYQVYSNAADDGVILGKTEGCQKRYGEKCKYSMDKLLSMNFLRIWKGLKSLGVDVKEDFEL